MKLRKYNEAFEEGHWYDKEGNDLGGFYGRYRIVGNYSKSDKTLAGYAKSFGSLTEDFLDIETGLKHLEMEFKSKSIFGEDFPPTTFSHTVKVTHNDSGVSYEFILDMKF